MGQFWTKLILGDNVLGTRQKDKEITLRLQLGTSSRAIHGGAYFSAVSGRKFNLTTVLRPCRPLACCWMFFSRPLSLLYWISLNCQVPWGWHCIFRWICLQNVKMDLSRAIFFYLLHLPPQYMQKRVMLRRRLFWPTKKCVNRENR